MRKRQPEPRHVTGNKSHPERHTYEWPGVQQMVEVGGKRLVFKGHHFKNWEFSQPGGGCNRVSPNLAVVSPLQCKLGDQLTSQCINEPRTTVTTSLAFPGAALCRHSSASIPTGKARPCCLPWALQGCFCCCPPSKAPQPTLAPSRMARSPPEAFPWLSPLSELLVGLLSHRLGGAAG